MLLPPLLIEVAVAAFAGIEGVAFALAYMDALARNG
jgi:hypothetical protein